MRKAAKKSATPKHGKKKAVKIPDLPAKDLQDREDLAGPSRRARPPLNLGL